MDSSLVLVLKIEEKVNVVTEPQNIQRGQLIKLTNLFLKKLEIHHFIL